MQLKPVSTAGGVWWLCPACYRKYTSFYYLALHLDFQHPQLVYLSTQDSVLISGPDILDLEVHDSRQISLILSPDIDEDFYCPPCARFEAANGMKYHFTVRHPYLIYTYLPYENKFLIFEGGAF